MFVSPTNMIIASRPSLSTTIFAKSYKWPKLLETKFSPTTLRLHPRPAAVKNFHLAAARRAVVQKLPTSRRDNALVVLL